MTTSSINSTSKPAKRQECPRCHAPAAFGPRMVMGQFWITRCSQCRYYTHEALPTIQKKIIYLDQCVLSHILTSQEQRWKDVYGRLRALCHFQVITCPYSNVHREESLLADYSRDVLKELYRELSCGDQFLPPIEIEQNQLLESIGLYLQGAPAPSQWDKPRLWKEFCGEDPHRWWGDMQVYADFPTDLAAIARLREDKDRLHDSLGSVADYWKSEHSQKFKDDVERETLDYGRVQVECYRELVNGPKEIESMLSGELLEAFRSIVRPGIFNPDTPPGIQPGVRLVHSLAVEAHRAHPEEVDPVSIVEEFFKSKHAAQTPFLYISSRLSAAIAQQVRSPKGARSTKRGDSYDITAISSFAPYCDAMVVDNEFCAIASQKNIDVPGRYKVKLFSARILDQFIQYLERLLTDTSHEHRAALKQVFPHFAWLPLLKTE